MGLTPRMRVARLPEKLRAIRVRLNLSQGGMLQLLDFAELGDRSIISGYERGEREPPLPVLLRYARSIEMSVDYLIDDALDLPD
ncbi:MAG: helix-turn-helix transcriptional regulator [Pyrinomonadaceae bacterium]